MFSYDPVCGKRINRNKAHITIEFDGNEYLLCCPLCQSEFENDPQTYADEKAALKKNNRAGK